MKAKPTELHCNLFHYWFEDFVDFEHYTEHNSIILTSTFDFTQRLDYFVSMPKNKVFLSQKNTKNNRKYHDVKLSDHHKIIFQFIGIVAFSFYFIRLFGSFRAQEIPMCVQVRHGKHLLYHCIAANGINLLIQGKHSGG